MFVEELFSYEEYLRKEKQKNYYYYYNTNDNYSMHICNKMQKKTPKTFCVWGAVYKLSLHYTIMSTKILQQDVHLVFMQKKKKKLLITL